MGLICTPHHVHSESAEPDQAAAIEGLIRKGTFAAAEQEARALLRQAEHAHGTESLEAARVLDLLSEAMRLGGKGGTRDAREACDRSVRIREKLLGPNHPAYATSLHHLGFLLYVNGSLAEARPVLERALRIRESSLGTKHPQVAASLLPLAGLVSDLGDHAKAESLLVRARSIRVTEFGPDSPEVAECLAAIATARYRSGDFATSTTLHEQALSLWVKAFGPLHPKVGTILNNLAAVQFETGDYTGAVSSVTRALQIRVRNLGARHELVAATLSNLGMYLAAQGRLTDARHRYQQALSVREARFGVDSPEVGRLLTRLGLLELQVSNFHAARPLLERAVANLTAGLGEEHADLADALAGLATTHAAQGDTASARRLYGRAIRIREEVLGPKHPDVGLILTQYARVLTACGEHSSAVDLALRAEEISREHLRLTSRSLAESQALAYASARPGGGKVALLALMGAPHPAPEVVGRVWDSLIRGRTLVLDEIASRNRAMAGAGDVEASQMMEALGSARRRLANLLVAGPRGESADRYRAVVERTQGETERVERALAERSAQFRREIERSRMGFSEVASSLPRDDALVAYATAGDSSKLSYVAFVLRPGARDPVMVRIGAVSSADPIIDRWLSLVSRSGVTEERLLTSGTALRHMAWDPVAAHLGNAKRVFIVPDGAMYLVNFAALPAESGRYLLESGIVIHYLSAERDLVGDPSLHPNRRGLLAIGDPAFGGVPSGRNVTRGRNSDCPDFRSLRFHRLRHSGREAQEIASIWGKPEETVTLTRSQATEAAFKREAPGRSVLHIATHGFFLSSACEPLVNQNRGISGVARPGQAPNRRIVPRHNPLHLAGLALAHANQRSRATMEEEDGILTAEEVAVLNLSGVQWAVLSACDTGRGRIQTGEGVLGLRRAFQVAGTRTVILSLWAVDDESARRWMRALYENRVLGGLDTAAAVAQASVRVLQERRAQALGTSPFYWAAFVAAGDWK